MNIKRLLSWVLPSRRLLRLTTYLVCVCLVSAAIAARAAYAKANEAGLEFGEQLSGLDDLTRGANVILVNGERFHRVIAFVDGSVGSVLDRIQKDCETTPGLLAHVPGPSTDCYGNDPVNANATISGSTASWDNLATLLKAGIAGVREVDPNIKVMLHVENTDDLSGVKWWVDNAESRGVSFDVLGLSCYTAFQGPPSVWEDTFTDLAASYPNLEFAIAEYNPDRTAANTIMKGLPGGRGLGTFFWEPTLGGEWGDAMFTWQNSTQRANPDDFAEFDALRADLGL
jgi:arabinogalactan endo-1,4-beta-galactosidase